MSKKPTDHRRHLSRQLIFDDCGSPGNGSSFEDKYVDYELDTESMAASVMDVQRREDYWLDPLPYR